jgi:hypothetical protein
LLGRYALSESHPALLGLLLQVLAKLHSLVWR